MTFVVVERSFEERTDPQTLQALEDAVAGCLSDHRVEALYSYMSRDGRRMICVYQAPDAEAVRITQDTGTLPYDRIWSAERIPLPPVLDKPDSYTAVVVQRALPMKTTRDMVEELTKPTFACLERRKGAPVESYLSRDGRRMVCAFLAPDAESVREANKEAGMPMERAWAAQRIG